jgi:hypothetical protein
MPINARIFYATSCAYSDSSSGIVESLAGCALSGVAISSTFSLSSYRALSSGEVSSLAVSCSSVDAIVTGISCSSASTSDSEL